MGFWGGSILRTLSSRHCAPPPAAASFPLPPHHTSCVSLPVSPNSRPQTSPIPNTLPKYFARSQPNGKQRRRSTGTRYPKTIPALLCLPLRCCPLAPGASRWEPPPPKLPEAFQFPPPDTNPRRRRCFFQACVSDNPYLPDRLVASAPVHPTAATMTSPQDRAQHYVSLLDKEVRPCCPTTGSCPAPFSPRFSLTEPCRSSPSTPS